MAASNTTVVMAGGYQPAPTTTVVVQQKRSGNACKAAIPAMHIGYAIFCLIWNIFFPGWGTVFAGFSVFCCANKDQSTGGRVGTMCINFWVGILQMATVWLFLIGWIWSIMWGAAFIAMSEDYHNDHTETTVITTGGGATLAPQPMVITTNTNSMAQAPPPQQQHPPPQQQHPPPPQQYPPHEQAPPPVYSEQPAAGQPTEDQMPGQVTEEKL